MTTPGAVRLVRELEAWVAPSRGAEQLRKEYLALLDGRGAAALRRESGAAHVTASCFIFSADLEEILLCFHRKGRFWVQTGGHVEPEDPSVRAAALREAHEEAGLAGLVLVPDLLDLDRHDLSEGFGACRTHWDVGFAALAPTGAVPHVSAESDAVAWFPVDDVPSPAAGGVAARARQLRDAIRDDGRRPPRGTATGGT